MGPIQTLHELISWLTRRWQVIVAITALGAVVGLVMAMRTERVYSASAVIQVINPVVAVGEDGTGVTPPDVTRRVQIIEQRLMSREALLDLADRFDLFAGAAIRPAEQVAMMREAFSISAIAAAQQGFSRDGSLSALIVSASNGEPQLAAAIANDLADALVRESVSDRQSDARQALEFFSAEEARLEVGIADLETRIATYRSENEAYLPAAVAIQRHPAGPASAQTRCSRALGSKDCTPARPAAAFYTDRADPEFRLRRPLRHQRPSPTAATIRSDSNGSRARHEVLSEYQVLGRASGAGDADGGASPHVRSTPRCEIQARSRELTGDHRNVI